MERKRTRRKPGNGRLRWVIGGVGAVIVLALVIFLVQRYTPSKERMALTDYFVLTEEDQAAVIVDGTYYEDEADTPVHGIYQDGHPYLEISFLKEYLDDGYVYDGTENILRYITSSHVISVSPGSSTYMVDRSREQADHNIMIARDGAVYLSLDFMKQYTDLTYSIAEEPCRLIIEKAGYEKTTAALKRDTELRRHGGVKSPILKDGKEGDVVSVLDDYGSWSLVLTQDGVLGCVQNSRLGSRQQVVTEATLPKEEFSHILLDTDVVLGWHQVTSASANSGIADVLSRASGMNVISPTWFYLDDNQGGIADLGSRSYVDYCHQQGVQVWGLVSNLENDEVDTTSVLNTTSSRDALVNNLIAAAITYNLDGINVDIEQLSGAAADGYIAFVKELSLKCEKNDLILSVDNYAPSASSMIYNRDVQADFADYVIIMAYDEHYSGGDEAGSVASIGFVEDAVKATLEEVPKEQVIMGMPLYSRVWYYDGTTLKSSAMGVAATANYIADHNMTMTWDEKLGQNYGEYTQDGVTYQLWQEDAFSIEEKLKVLTEHDLAGGAFWKLGFDDASIWSVTAKYLNP